MQTYSNKQELDFSKESMDISHLLHALDKHVLEKSCGNGGIQHYFKEQGYTWNFGQNITTHLMMQVWVLILYILPGAAKQSKPSTTKRLLLCCQ